MAAVHDIFEFVNPPSQADLDIMLATLSEIDYPWDRVRPFAAADPDEHVLIKWEDEGEHWATFRRHEASIHIGPYAPDWMLGFAFAHELGHLVDAAVFTRADRDALTELFHGPETHKYDGKDGAWLMRHDVKHSESWPNRLSPMKFRLNESFAEHFAMAFAPKTWAASKRFRTRQYVHVTDDLAELKRLTLAAGATPPSFSTFEPKDGIYRLYWAFFKRDPDPGGYLHWRDKHARGATLNGIATEFTRSQEFRNTYGVLDDGEFVRMVYRNVLDREPDSQGYYHWTNHLRNGRSRGYVMVGFSESQEFKNKTS